MIIFDLACKHEHRFEGWFQSQSNYDSQLERALISCPQCGVTEIRRVPSAVHLVKPTVVTQVAAKEPSVAAQPSMRTAIQQLVSIIVANSEDVGKNFTQEARKIHYMDADTPQRSIRGEASSDEFELLREEGIEVLRLPTLKKEDIN